MGNGVHGANITLAVRHVESVFRQEKGNATIPPQLMVVKTASVHHFSHESVMYTNGVQVSKLLQFSTELFSPRLNYKKTFLYFEMFVIYD